MRTSSPSSSSSSYSNNAGYSDHRGGNETGSTTTTNAHSRPRLQKEEEGGNHSSNNTIATAVAVPVYSNYDHTDRETKEAECYDASYSYNYNATSDSNYNTNNTSTNTTAYASPLDYVTAAANVAAEFIETTVRPTLSSLRERKHERRKDRKERKLAKRINRHERKYGTVPIPMAPQPQQQDQRPFHPPSNNDTYQQQGRQQHQQQQPRQTQQQESARLVNAGTIGRDKHTIRQLLRTNYCMYHKEARVVHQILSLLHNSIGQQFIPTVIAADNTITAPGYSIPFPTECKLVTNNAIGQYAVPTQYESLLNRCLVLHGYIPYYNYQSHEMFFQLIDIYLPYPYFPTVPPVVYVRKQLPMNQPWTTTDTNDNGNEELRIYHPFIDIQSGKVLTREFEYISNWTRKHSTLLEMVHQLSNYFTQRPPVFLPLNEQQQRTTGSAEAAHVVQEINFTPDQHYYQQPQQVQQNLQQTHDHQQQKQVTPKQGLEQQQKQEHYVYPCIKVTTVQFESDDDSYEQHQQDEEQQDDKINNDYDDNDNEEEDEEDEKIITVPFPEILAPRRITTTSTMSSSHYLYEQLSQPDNQEDNNNETDFNDHGYGSDFLLERQQQQQEEIDKTEALAKILTEVATLTGFDQQPDDDDDDDDDDKQPARQTPIDSSDLKRFVNQTHGTTYNLNPRTPLLSERIIAERTMQHLDCAGSVCDSTVSSLTTAHPLMSSSIIVPPGSVVSKVHGSTSTVAELGKVESVRLQIPGSIDAASFTTSKTVETMVVGPSSTPVADIPKKNPQLRASSLPFKIMGVNTKAALAAQTSQSVAKGEPIVAATDRSVQLQPSLSSSSSSIQQDNTYRSRLQYRQHTT